MNEKHFTEKHFTEKHFTEKHFNSKEIKEKIKTISEMYKDVSDNKVFNIVVNCYKQMLEQVEILKAISDFEPDQIGIDPHMQIAIFAKKMARDHLKKIGELDLNTTQHTEDPKSFAKE